MRVILGLEWKHLEKKCKRGMAGPWLLVGEISNVPAPLDANPETNTKRGGLKERSENSSVSKRGDRKRNRPAQKRPHFQRKGESFPTRANCEHGTQEKGKRKNGGGEQKKNPGIRLKKRM